MKGGDIQACDHSKRHTAFVNYSTREKLTVHVQAPPGRLDSMQPVTGHDACAGAHLDGWAGTTPCLYYGASKIP